MIWTVSMWLRIKTSEEHGDGLPGSLKFWEVLE
jgi:hypothetical protein